MARPSKYTDEILDVICERLSEGEPLAQICRDEGMPTDRTVRNWVRERDDVSSAIARAREIGFDRIAEDCLAIADEQAGDVQRDKLRIETRLKLLAKWDPKRFGDRNQMELSGPNGGPVEQTTRIEIVAVEAKAPE
ncbi:hypothetical protein [Coralloluteibacterium thermophilus]|uniref:Terminase small subunit protein n=1 Tax=Coralloluteibacterium thermophilum TaxID=2707049 RepID=A0ABV9NQG5_9GAMM